MTIQRKMNKNIDSIALTNFFKNYRKNMWIYPGVLKENFPYLFLKSMIFYLNWKSKEFCKVIMNYIVVIAKNLWGQYVCLMSYQKLLNVNSAIANFPQ